MTARLSLGLRTHMLAATTLRHVLAAIHAAVAVGVGAAAAGGMLSGLMLPVLGMLPALVLCMLGMLSVLGVLPGLVLRMVLVSGRRGLSGGWDGEDERHRGNENLHFRSPESSIEGYSNLQANRGGGGSASGLRPWIALEAIASAGAAAGSGCSAR